MYTYAYWTVNTEQPYSHTKIVKNISIDILYSSHKMLHNDKQTKKENEHQKRALLNVSLIQFLLNELAPFPANEIC
jgi:hypothetical protein